MNEEIERVTKPKEEVKNIENRFHIGDFVHIPLKPPQGIERKIDDKWSRMPLEIEEIIMTNPRTYKLKGKTEKYYYKQLRKA